ncbi:MAG: alanine--tRNA ligase, partial [candidate division Zixibacteria bacterium]|nr:alanine--tRNA ligase [candidate division Zixibacteria bacterium]
TMMPFPHIAVILDKTPFYVESGGQISDLGVLRGESLEIRITAMHKHNDFYIHEGEVVRGEMSDIIDAIDIEVTAEVDGPRRINIMRNHTATHLMHAALRRILGEHVEQAGSLVSDEKLRFDFSHFEGLTKEQVSEVEQTVNAEIMKASKVMTAVMSLEEAKKTGAMALFGEKYSDKVRVVSVGEFSKELCGGTHVSNTSEIGPFMITLEGGIASGIRRIEAITGEQAIAKMLRDKSAVGEVSRNLKTPEEQVAMAVRKLIDDSQRLQKDIKKLKQIRFSSGEAVGECDKIGALIYQTHDFGEVERDEITGWADGFKNASGPVVAAALGAVNGKVMLVSSASPAAVAAGIHIGNAAKRLFERFGSRGGGRENFAQGAAPPDVSPAELFAAYKEILSEVTKV